MDIDGHEYNILQHNQNSISRNFGPFLLHSTIDIVASIDKEIGSCIFPYQFSLGHFDIFSIEQILLEEGLLIYG